MAYPTSPMTGTTLANFRPNIWSKETLAALESVLVLVPRIKHYDRDIKSSGQTVEIPNLSNLSANLKVAGTAVTLNYPTEGKTTITIDQHYESSFFLEDFAEAQSAYDAASEYTQKTGYALAEKMDATVVAEITDNATYSAGAYGTALNDTTILVANRYLDEAKVPTTERTLAVTPVGKQQMLAIDKYVTYNNLGTGAAIVNGKIGEIYGVTVVMSQNLRTDAGTPTEENNLLFHKEACAIAIQKDIKFEEQRKAEYLATLYVASALWGVEMLRHDAACVVKC
jgi:N4-gp56 family major capsid protein